MDNVFSKIKALADQRGLSINALCEQVGVNPSTVHKWNGKNPSSIDTYNKIMAYLQPRTQYLAQVGDVVDLVIYDKNCRTHSSLKALRVEAVIEEEGIYFVSLFNLPISLADNKAETEQIQFKIYPVSGAVKV